MERAWSYSFRWGRAGTQTAVFRQTLERLVAGYPVGSALKYLPERYAGISVELATLLEDKKFDVKVDDSELAGLWTANNDARSYVIIGDPAVRLPVADSGAATTDRNAIDLRSAAEASPPQTKPSSATTEQEPVVSLDGGEQAIPQAAEQNTVTVTTYTAADVDSGGRRELAAQTSFRLDGDVETVIAADQAKNEDLLELHRKMVDRAVDARLQYLKLAKGKD